MALSSPYSLPSIPTPLATTVLYSLTAVEEGACQDLFVATCVRDSRVSHQN